MNIETAALLKLLHGFCYPGGEEPARLIRAIRTTQRGEIRAAPGGRWLSFTAEEVIEATQSRFRWDARLGEGADAPSVTDAYEDGHGRALIRTGGALPVRTGGGLDLDKGELQRYLASIPMCPPILLRHPSLQWACVGPHTLRVLDLKDATGAFVDLDLWMDGRPLSSRADRPRLIGTQIKTTPWSATYDDMREWEGLRLPARLEASWHPADGSFVYIRSEITSFVAVR